MGTCVSKSKKAKHQPPRHPAKDLAPEHDPASRNPPEEEKVKEVLSETPKPSVPARSIEKEEPEKPHPPSPEKTRAPLEEESVEVSETVSVSETASATVTEDSNATEVQQPSRRGQYASRREDLPCRKSASPARREASPGKRMEGVGPRAAGRTVSASRDAGSLAAERRNRVRRVGGEVGARGNVPRSRSPATRGDSGGRPAVNRNGSRRMPQSPNRGPTAAGRVYGQSLGDGGGGGDGGGVKAGEREMKSQEQSDLWSQNMGFYGV